MIRFLGFLRRIENVPFEKIQENKNFFMVITPKGGHIEYFVELIPNRWNVGVALKFLQLLEKKNNN